MRFGAALAQKFSSLRNAGSPRVTTFVAELLLRHQSNGGFGEAAKQHLYRATVGFGPFAHTAHALLILD
jgi:hypothetical protein